MSFNFQRKTDWSKALKSASSQLLIGLFLSGTAYAGANTETVLTGSRKDGVSASVKKADITGKVTDSQGEPLPGVSVKIKGASVAVSTDVDGLYRINVTTGNETLVFSYIGFKTVEVPLNGRSSVNVILEEEVSSLDEVVVVGYGVVKKRDLTGAVSSVKGSEIAMNPVTNAMEAVQGRVAGLDIQRSDGRAGAAPQVQLRGNRSLTASGDPLYIIDGLPGNITNLNPNDIESIDVLKDASSTAIYGSAGANGVIIITTKKAKEGKVEIDFDTYVGINSFASFPKPLLGDAWIRYQEDRYFASKGVKPGSVLDLGLPTYARDAIEAGQWINWVDETLQTGVQQNHNLSIRGGTEKTRGYFSFGYMGEEGIYQGDKAELYTSRAGVDVNFNKILKAGVQTVFSWKDFDRTNSRINKAFGIYPLGQAYNEDGTVNLYPIGDGSTVSPIANYAHGVYLNNSKNLYLNLKPYIEITPFKNFSLRSNFGASLSSNRTGIFENENSYNLASEAKTNKQASYSTGLGYNYIWENILNYNFTLNKDHDFTLTGITSYSDNRSESSLIQGEGLDYDEFIYYNMSSVGNITAKSSAFVGTKKLSFAGRVNYSYKGKYLVTASTRWDGASQLVNKWHVFPSVAGAWRISEENFMSDTREWLDNLKLRAGWGVTGNANIPAYVSSTEVASKGVNMTLGGDNLLPIYVLKQALGNPDLTWEKSYNTNIGLDLSFLKGRFDVVMDWYHTYTDGVLWARRVPISSGGFDAKNPYTITSNIAETQNKGFEFTLNSRNINKNDFQWNSALTFTTSREKLKSIDLGNGVTADDLISEGLFVGSPIRTIYGYKKIGVWQLGEEEEALKYGAKPGDIKLQTVERFDENGVSDGGVHVYSPADKMIVGHRNPDWTLGFQNSFYYKNFDLSLFMNMRYGQTIDAALLGYYNTVAQPASYSYWTPSNPTNDFPQPSLEPGFTENYKSALTLVDGSYVKIKNITLGYTIPNKVGTKLGFSRLRAYGTVYNPIIFTKSKLLKDVDPETGGSDSFPLFKQLVFGLNVSF